MQNIFVAIATKRSPSQRAQHEPGHGTGTWSSIGQIQMTTLTYRGKEYVQNKEAAQKQFIELTYRKTVYTNRKNEVASDHPVLIYRGTSYQR